jgi:segregation and condensation protein A
LSGEVSDRALRRRAAVASTLVAGLELTRTGTLALDQDAAWTAIRMGRRLMPRMVDMSESS